jgi:hypothetical protein
LWEGDVVGSVVSSVLVVWTWELSELVKIETGSVVPLRMGGSGGRVSGSSKAHARGANQCDREAGSNVSAHFGVRSIPFGCKFDGKLLSSSHCLQSLQTIHREHEGSEVSAPRQAKVEVLLLRLLLVSGQDLCWILLYVRRCVGVGDPNIEDRRRSLAPKAVGCHIATEFRRNHCDTVDSSTSSCVPTRVD